MKKIIVEVSATGETKVTTQGFAGSECLSKDITELEAALGKRGKVARTAEFYKQEAKAQQKIGGK